MPGTRNPAYRREAAGALGGHVGPWEWFADERVGRRILEWRLRIELEIELLRPPIKSAKRIPAPPALGLHLTIGRDEIIGLHLRRLAASSINRLASRRGGLTDLHAAALNTSRAGRSSLVGSQRGITLNVFDLIQANAKFLGRDLADSDPQPLAEIDLATEHGHRAIAVHGRGTNPPPWDQAAAVQRPALARVFACARR